MPLTPEEVEHVALLGRLRLTDEEREQFTSQLNSILEHFEQLRQVETAGVPSLSHAIEMTNVLREDEPQPSLTPEEALANAPAAERDSFVVPRVIE